MSVGRLVQGKGHILLAQILPQLINKVPNLVWLIVGDGPELKDVLRSIEQNNLQTIVRFVGKVPHENLANYYALSDIFVLPTHETSYASEGFGTVFLEAGACSIPAVAGRVGGVEEAVEHGVTGLVVDAFNQAELASSIVYLLEHPEFVKQLGQQARLRVQEEFRWHKQLEKLNS
jgi:phosphatidylinositol alpha-1,6-mannosyltransferase